MIDFLDPCLLPISPEKNRSLVDAELSLSTLTLVHLAVFSRNFFQKSNRIPIAIRLTNSLSDAIK